MKLMDRRTKMISFRLSPTEYNQLRDACVHLGIQNVSELARVAMQQILTGGANQPNYDYEIKSLRDRVGSLAIEVDQLARRIQKQSHSASASGTHH